MPPVIGLAPPADSNPQKQESVDRYDQTLRMKRLNPAFRIQLIAAILLAAALSCAVTAWSAPPARSTTLHAIHALSHADAAGEPSVAFEATVTYRRARETTLFVEDLGEGIYVWASEDIKLAAGDRVLIEGKVQDSFRPIVIARTVTLLHHGALPAPVPATFDELIHSKFDSTLVSIRGQVLSTDLVRGGDSLVLLSDGTTIQIYVDSRDVTAMKGLLDAEVEITGVALARFDGKMQQTGVQISAGSLAEIKVIKYADQSPWSTPVTRMDEIISQYRVKNLSRRVRIHGTITYYQPGSHLVLQSGTRSLWIMTEVESPLRIGSEADVTGFPDVHDGFLTLAEGEVRESPVYAPIAPQPATAADLSSSKHLFDLVSIEGKIVMEVRENAQDEYVLVADGQVFSAIYHHPSVEGMQPLPMNEVPVESIVRVAGISTPLTNSNSDPFREGVPFEILMRTPDDIAVVASPSLLTVRNLMMVVGLLLILFVAAGARAWFIERRARSKVASMAYIERRRSRILEDINGSCPITEIVEQITELVSFKLKGAPCWCLLNGSAQAGNRPRYPGSLRVVSREISSRSGQTHGEVHAAFDPLTTPSAIESEALIMAAGLAGLAVETRRLYTDLRRRSEFDLLTDIQNRFSFEKHLDAQIAEAGQQAAVFGLIYVDLDDFKQVNDVYGHRVGDLYLQQAAIRMKQQLRAVDTIARLGGDEFAVLVPAVRGRADVEEIAFRLERSFDAPFTVDGAILHPSASVGIALYPEDGTTRDSILSAADAAMYVRKHTRRQTKEMLADMEPDRMRAEQT